MQPKTDMDKFTAILRTAHNTSLGLRHRLSLCVRAADEIDRLRAESAAQAETLRAERDAARALSDELDFLHHEGGEESIAREIERARAEGYRQGIEAAAAEANRRDPDKPANYLHRRDAIPEGIRALTPPAR